MEKDTELYFHNGEAIELQKIPVLPANEFKREILEAIQNGGRLAAFFGVPIACQKSVQLFAVIAHDGVGNLSIVSSEATDRYPSLTPECPQAHLFEREIAEQWGLIPEGHPWLKPIRFHASYRPGYDGWQRQEKEQILPGVTDFFRIQGEEIHEVAVGPVHAGIIEPGHFRFQCHGEKVLHLEISLGYQHRGIEKALWGGPDKRTIHLMETLAGDTTIGHALAYCQALEALAGCDVPLRAQALRAIALELERLANHAGDLGALANDVGFLPTAAYCGRIRGDFLNMTSLLCGNRFGRNLLCPGGARFDLDAAGISELTKRLGQASKDISSAVNLLWSSPSVLGRFEDTGEMTKEIAETLGLVGPVARASGVERDVRFDFPSGLYRFSQIPISVASRGDVFSRAYVRWLEIERSIEFIQDQLQSISAGDLKISPGVLRSNALVVSLVEGWRGEICHVALTDKDGKFLHYKVVDPSFHNWMGLAMAMRYQDISDFPLCNKSFNLSYCGHDL